MPAINANSFSKSQGADHKDCSDLLPSHIPIKNIVEPYMTIMSPACLTPTLTASAAASIVPTVTGIPIGKPVSAEAFLVK